MDSLITHFSIIKEPRQLSKIEHDLIDIWGALEGGLPKRAACE